MRKMHIRRNVFLPLRATQEHVGIPALAAGCGVGPASLGRPDRLARDMRTSRRA